MNPGAGQHANLRHSIFKEMQFAIFAIYVNLEQGSSIDLQDCSGSLGAARVWLSIVVLK